MSAAKKAFYRFTAAHFIVTAATGLVLYFRPGGNRPGLYQDGVKEILVMIHNGEWLSYFILGKPVYSGIIIGLLLSFVVIRMALRTFAGPPQGEQS